jgi:hypothetical protein
LANSGVSKHGAGKRNINVPHNLKIHPNLIEID